MSEARSERERRWAGTMAGHGEGPVRRAHVDADAKLGPVDGFDRAAREDAEDALLAPGRHPGARRRSPRGGGGARRLAHVLRARPRPHPARLAVPAALRQDPGLHLPGGPPAHPPDPRARGRAGGHRHRPGAAASTSRSPRRSRSGTTAATARSATPARTRSRRTSPGGTTTRSGAPTSCSRRSTSVPRRSTASATTRGPGRRPRTPEGEVVAWADRIAYVVPRLRGRGRRRHRDAGDAARGGAGDRRRPAAVPPARRPDLRGGRDQPGHTARSACGRARRRARRVPRVQLRAHLHAAGVDGAERRRDPGAPGAGGVLRRPAEHAARARARGRARRRAGRVRRRGCGRPSPTSPA